MESYSLSSHLENIYAAAPVNAGRPIIGITANHEGIDATIRDKYYEQVVAAGGTPVVIPPVESVEVIAATVEMLDGLILSGGADYDPRWADEARSETVTNINAARDLPELLITQFARNKQLPVLGICRGMQTIAMTLGGRLMQDIDEEFAQQGREHVPFICHNQTEERNVTTHSVSVTPDSVLCTLYGGTTTLEVNSFHHQAVKCTGADFKVTAVAPDGVIEAMEAADGAPIMGVQWHPEWLGDNGLPLFRWLVDQSRCYAEAKRLHSACLTLDSHCDTPMFFPQGIRFEHRDNRILVDLHKMIDGRLDAVTMVAYLPQPKEGEVFQDKVAFPVSGPKEYADLIFNKIEDIVKENPSHLSLASTPAQLYANKQAGRKSIILGIENGLALEDSAANVEHFARRGITYITLCHNGDNLICDSARGTQTHGGVSRFGEEVISQMNRWGVMVDLSHAAESSFYDALQMSQTPIVCSHSNCRALCDHPRNLSDDQLRSLARIGGVAQITLYNGFLKRQGQAGVMDVMNHLDHAVKVMGVEHVGLGTDFDGDGGVPGLRDASALLRFTMELLHRRYTEDDIRLIWGENWLRVMRIAQSGRLKH